MNNVFIIFLLTSGIIYSQNNPDGNEPSIHLMTYYTGGDYITPINKFDLEDNFNFDIKIKLPIASNGTIVFSYVTDIFGYPTGSGTGSSQPKYEYNIVKYGLGLSFYLE